MSIEVFEDGMPSGDSLSVARRWRDDVRDESFTRYWQYSAQPTAEHYDALLDNIQESTTALERSIAILADTSMEETCVQPVSELLFREDTERVTKLRSLVYGLEFHELQTDRAVVLTFIETCRQDLYGDSDEFARSVSNVFKHAALDDLAWLSFWLDEQQSPDHAAQQQAPETPIALETAEATEPTTTGFGRFSLRALRNLWRRHTY